jgi:uncharacterized protein with FMN-binding domain
MLSHNKKRESLAGKLLLSSALVAVTLVSGWWQRNNAGGPILVMAPAPLPPAPNRLMPVLNKSATASPAATQPLAPDANAASNLADAPSHPPAAPHSQKSFAIVKAAPQTITPTVTPTASEAQSQQNQTSPPSSASSSLTAQQAMQMYLPTDDVSPPLPLVTGNPEPGAGSPVTAGAHLEDGDYVSDKQELAWGDLKVKISIHGGSITGVQILQFPDHRSQSLYLSQMAGPILESEVIKSQKSQVDIVSSATDTSYAFQDTVANAIIKATRE